MSTCDLAILGAEHHGEIVDLFVGQGEIIECVPTGKHTIAENIAKYEAQGLILLPSLTDVHTHLREPGFEYKEDVESGLRAAAHGGFGNIMCMANTLPINDNASITEFILEQANISWPLGPRLFPIGALSKGLEGKELAPMAELAQAGCVAISNDGMPIYSTEIMRRAMEYAANWGLIVIDHCEDPAFALASGMNEGRISSLLGLPAQPDAAEAIQVSRDILLAEYLDLPVHLAHISCKRSVDIIRFAKERGIKVTAETCPHYLTLTERAVVGYDTSAKVNPPLRTEQDVTSLLEALNEGIIDMLATDHAPHARHEKEVEFEHAPCGISGLDTALSLSWELLVAKKLSEDAFLRAWTTSPCQTFGLPLNTFSKGDSADFLLFDPEESWEVSAESMYSKSCNTPFAGRTLLGRVKAHFLAGEKIV